MLRFSGVCILLVAILAGLTSMGTVSAQSGPGSSEYEEEDCFIGGLIGKMRCYALVRPLSEGSSETITLRGVIIPSDSVVPEPDPLVILAGGPGQAASDMVAGLGRLFRKINNSRDLIFFDIRGSGLSHPISCSDDEDIPPLTHISPEEAMDTIRECAEGLGEILKSFTTKTAVADLEALRQALGVARLNLWGGSYGTRLAQYYIYAYPAQVRSVILDAVVPFQPSYLPLQAGNAMDALNKVSTDCAADEACARAFPDFDPLSLLDQIGQEREISFAHPVTGVSQTTTTSRVAVAQTIWSTLYSAESRIFIPYALSEAVARDNWGPMSVLAVDSAHYMGIETIYMGPFLSITCAEEKNNINRALSMPDPFFEGATARILETLCQIWPAASEPLPVPDDGMFAVPTIMISGEYDPITPPALAEHAAKAFVNVRHYRLKNGGHINSTVPCMTDFLALFIKDPLDAGLTPKCIADSHVPAFALGPRATTAQGETK